MNPLYKNKQAMWHLHPKFARVTLVLIILMMVAVFGGLALSFALLNEYVLFPCMGLVLVLTGVLCPFGVGMREYIIVTDSCIALVRQYTKFDKQLDYRTLRTYSWNDAYITLFGPVGKINKEHCIYKAYIGSKYLSPEDLRSRSKKKGMLCTKVNLYQLMSCEQFYKKPFQVVINKDPDQDIVLYRCQCHNSIVESISNSFVQGFDVSCFDLKDISRRAIVAYSIACLENALIHYNHTDEGWKVLLNEMWKFTNLDEYDSKVLQDWYGLLDLCPNTFVSPYSKYVGSHGDFNDDVVLARIDEQSYDALAKAIDNCHTAIGELCAGVYNVALATVHETFFDISFVTLLTCQESIIDVMYRNQIALPDTHPFEIYPHEIPQGNMRKHTMGKPFDGTKLSKFIQSEQISDGCGAD